MRDVLHIRDWANRRYCEVHALFCGQFTGKLSLHECAPLFVPDEGMRLSLDDDGCVNEERQETRFSFVGVCGHVYPEGLSAEQSVEMFVERCESLGRDCLQNETANWSYDR